MYFLKKKEKKKKYFLGQNWFWFPVLILFLLAHLSTHKKTLQNQK